MMKLRRGDPRSTSRWRRLAESVRVEGRSCCEKCKAPAKDVHHIQPLHLGGEPFSRSNLQLLCRTCHEAAHSDERSRRLTRGKPSRNEARTAFLEAFNNQVGGQT